MIYPKFLKKGNVIGVTATSDGVTDVLDKARFENGRKKLQRLGYQVRFTDNVFMADSTGRSSSGQQRGEELNQLVRDKNVDVIVAAKGGNFLNEMLEYVDYEAFLENPTWFQGYSDNTGMVHTLTTVCDIAAIYGSNFGEFGMQDWHASVRDNLEILTGNPLEQCSFDQYQTELSERVTGLEGYTCDTPVRWKPDDRTMMKQNYVEMKGRLIGGCLDVLIFLQGTKYDGTLSFIEKYKNDGIIWYLESFDLSGETLMMFLWKLKEMGWFQYTSGILFGRPLFYKNYTNTSYEESVMYALGALEVPVIFDCDFGHRGPRNTIINGAVATVKCNREGQGRISYQLIQ